MTSFLQYLTDAADIWGSTSPMTTYTRPVRRWHGRFHRKLSSKPPSPISKESYTVKNKISKINHILISKVVWILWLAALHYTHTTITMSLELPLSHSINSSSSEMLPYRLSEAQPVERNTVKPINLSANLHRHLRYRHLVAHEYYIIPVHTIENWIFSCGNTNKNV